MHHFFFSSSCRSVSPVFTTILQFVVVAAIAAIIYIVVTTLNSRRNRQSSQQICQSLADVLKAQRTAHSMTQEQVAEAVGVSRQAVSKWENGTAEPSTSNLLALAKLYGVDLNELLQDIQ